jgi:hypothetical protein
VIAEAHAALAILRLTEVVMLFGIAWYLMWSVPPAPQRSLRLVLCSILIAINVFAISIRVLILQLEPW